VPPRFAEPPFTCSGINSMFCFQRWEEAAGRLSFAFSPGFVRG
jgi:hypothetical protein